MSYVCTRQDRHSTTRYPPPPPCQGIIAVSIFAMPWCWQLLAPTGTIATVLPNPSAKTTSRGLRQHCLCLVWADSCGGVSNSIELRPSAFFHFILALFRRCTLFALPAWIVDGRHHLAIFPLPCHLIGIAIIPSPLHCLCWSGTMPLSLCPCLAGTICASAPPPLPLPLPPHYSYLLGIALKVCSLHWMHPLLPFLPMLTPIL